MVILHSDRGGLRGRGEAWLHSRHTLQVSSIAALRQLLACQKLLWAASCFASRSPLMIRSHALCNGTCLNQTCGFVSGLRCSCSFIGRLSPVLARGGAEAPPAPAERETGICLTCRIVSVSRCRWPYLSGVTRVTVVSCTHSLNRFGGSEQQLVVEGETGVTI